MPRGDKSSYTEKQKRMAEHIEESAEKRGAGKDEAERIAWSTVNKYTGGALKKKSSSAIKRAKPEAKAKKKTPTSRRTGPAKTSGETHKKLSAAGRKGAAAAARSVNRTALKKRAAAKKAASAKSKSSAKRSTGRKSTSKKGGKRGGKK